MLVCLHLLQVVHPTASIKRKGRRGQRCVTLLSSEDIQTLLPHRVAAVVFYLGFELCEYGLIVVLIVEIAGPVSRIVWVDETGGEGGSFVGIATGWHKREQ